MPHTPRMHPRTPAFAAFFCCCAFVFACTAHNTGEGEGEEEGEEGEGEGEEGCAPSERAGDVTIASAADLAALAGVTRIAGGLTVSAEFDGTSLLGLECLQEVGGELRISFLESLESLAGLEHLTTIGGGLNIYDNFLLESFDGLSALSRVDESEQMDLSFNSRVPCAEANAFVDRLRDACAERTGTCCAILAVLVLTGSEVGDDACSYPPVEEQCG